MNLNPLYEYAPDLNMNTTVHMSTRNEKGSRETTRKVPTLKESLTLDLILRKRYTASGLNNVAFADSLNGTPEERKHFRFDLVSAHIASALDAAEIPSNAKRRAADSVGDALGLVARTQALEDQVKRLAECARKLMVESHK